VNLGDRIIVQVLATYRPLVPLVRFTTFNIGTVARRTIIKDVAIEGTPPSPITPTVSFVLAEQSKEEDAGDMVVTVQLTAATSKTVTVPFVVDGSATAGVDYTATSSPVVITPGETTVDIIIHVIPDQIDEDDELVVVTMGNPTNAIKGTPNVHLATILDDDNPPEVYFATTDQAQSEELDAIAVLQLSAASSREVTVHYSVSGSALGAGTDYSMTASPIVIPAGDTSFSIVVDVIDDTLDEEDETITIALDLAINASVGVPDTHTITILDNDEPPWFLLPGRARREPKQPGLWL
jgi:F0F1-type ATP synthase beta subunit